MSSEIDKLLGPSPAHTGAQRSAVDDVLDAVVGPEKPRTAKICPECEGTEFRKRKPLGAGIITHKCLGCGFVITGPSQTSAKIVVEKAKASPQAKGPYYSGSKMRPPVDKHTPRYRTKSITRKKE
tara:strand:+ start:830 stop:1204 length:375 start_codon:yes stop_codon:yes gene_type:complete